MMPFISISFYRNSVSNRTSVYLLKSFYKLHKSTSKVQQTKSDSVIKQYEGLYRSGGTRQIHTITVCYIPLS